VLLLGLTCSASLEKKKRKRVYSSGGCQLLCIKGFSLVLNDKIVGTSLCS
jgi:hypothetical protein